MFENLGKGAVVVQAPVPGEGGKTITGTIRTKAANLAERAIKTFVQSFVASAVAAFQIAPKLNWSNLKVIGFSALAAGGSAVLSLIMNAVQSRSEG